MKKLTPYIFAVLLVIITMGSNVGFSQWSPNWKWSTGYPWGDDTRFIKMISASEWVGLGFNGGMIRTTDAGNTWTTRSDVSSYTGWNPPHLRDGWFFNSNNGIAVGDINFTGIICRTTNGGNNWTNTALTFPINAVYFADNNTGYVVGNINSGSKTTNSGVTWSPMTMGGTSMNLQAVFALDANNIYAVGGSDNFFKSTDGGNTWNNSTMTGSYVAPYSIYFKNSDTGFVGTALSKMLFTSDGGASWVSRPTPPTDQLLKKIIFNDPEILMVGDENNLFRTTDYGMSWSSLNFSSSAPDNATSAMYSMDKIGNNIVISGFLGLIYSSADNGNTWNSHTKSICKGYLTGVYASSMNGKIWAVGDPSPGSIMYSSNGGADWINDFGTAGLEYYRDVEFKDDNTGYICGEGASILRTSNGGVNWVSIPANTIQARNTIEIVDDNVVLIGGNAGILHRSTDGGLNFDLKNVGTSGQQINGFSFPDNNTGWAVMSRSILKSTDKGDTWNIQFNHTTTLLSISMVDVNTGYACGYSGSIFKTTNGGINWTQKASQIPNNLTKVDFANANTGYIVSGGGLGVPGSAEKTTNGGNTWFIINTGSNPLFGLQVLHPDSAITVGYANILKYMAPSTDFKLSLKMNFELCPNKDTVTVELRSSTSPFNIIESRKGIAGQGIASVFNFTSVTNGTQYYISVKNRNSINTWSSAPVSFSGNALSYDFTSAASQAYGNNLTNVNSLWSYYQGDVNQDEAVNLSDVLQIYNDGSNYVTGPYVTTDLNCDGFVDLSDLIPASNSSSNFIAVQKP